MKKAFLAEAHPTTQLLYAGLIFVGSWIVFQLIGMISGMFLYGFSAKDILNVYESFNNPVMIGFLKYVQGITSVGMFIIASGITAWSIENDWKSFLGLNQKPELMVSLLAVAFILIILPFTNLLAYFNTNLHLPAFLSGIENFFRIQETKMSEIMESLLKSYGTGALVVNLFVIAVIPAIGEELTFRGVIQKLLYRWFSHPHWAIFVTAFLFSATHFQFLSFLPRFFLGIILGYLFYWSKSIWLTMLVHFINNAVAVIFYHYYYNGSIGNYMEKVGTPQNDIIFAIMGAIAGYTLIYLIYRKFQSLKNTVVNKNKY